MPEMLKKQELITLSEYIELTIFHYCTEKNYKEKIVYLNKIINIETILGRIMSKSDIKIHQVNVYTKLSE